jgi:hypothetical protein
MGKFLAEGKNSLVLLLQTFFCPTHPSYCYCNFIPRDIYPQYGHPLASDDAPVWEVEDEDDVRVYAAPMSHGIPCVGYVVEEATRPGRLRNELVQPLVERNLQALKEAGFRVPMKAMAVIKNMPVGTAFTFPDGTTITQEQAVEPPRKGRKVVICGDTANCRAIEGKTNWSTISFRFAEKHHVSRMFFSKNISQLWRKTVMSLYTKRQMLFFPELIETPI